MAQGYVCFDLSMFVPGLARLADGIEAIDERAWSFIIKHRCGEADLPAGGIEQASRAHALAEQDYAAGRFAFSFRRLQDSPANRRVPAFAALRVLLGSTAVLELLATVTGRVPLAVSQFYVSRFDQGNFLSTHCDPGQSFGLAVNLTRRWDPNHGGLTLVLDDDRTAVRACLVPTRFQALLFDTSARQVPHCVSMVTARPTVPRLAAIARYATGEADGQ
ncbi:hypothetical protein [Stenotrophomonas rhizophila]|uniref:hypothetical protein n=1 Tax=Stenotrophomonas rhizophila TaxID=216778 RepID=UPI001E3FE034|nr:hypothetical protein [Stenotrophomonas rhizophila]MCC7634931.1 hypothetical protein [Stenotrophomonas rhizophila]MCC7664286.1 hypothetical protein [Stenotrophomonas rhizophila]